MKKILCMLLCVALFLSGCAVVDIVDKKVPASITGSPTDLSEENTTDMPRIIETTEEDKDKDNDSGYKIIETYVNDGNGQLSRKITFELPVEWNGDSNVYGIANENGFMMKLDIVDINTMLREDVLSEYNINMENEFVIEVLEKDIYMTENYEIFHYKYINGYEHASLIHVYYLYSNGERFRFAGYIFRENNPEYDEIFKRIAESVRFQF